jgi:Trk-type K+ transport system membrane component
MGSHHFSPFSAVFHSISAFCNAGFSLTPNSLVQYQGNWPVNKALTLLFFSLLIIFVCVILLDFIEGGDIPYTLTRGQFLEILFETVSAFGTVGLRTGLTAKLSPIGKTIIIFLMFAGRLGPLVLLASIQSMRTKLLYSIPALSTRPCQH